MTNNAPKSWILRHHRSFTGIVLIFLAVVLLAGQDYLSQAISRFLFDTTPDPISLLTIISLAYSAYLWKTDKAKQAESHKPPVNASLLTQRLDQSIRRFNRATTRNVYLGTVLLIIVEIVRVVRFFHHD